MLFACDVAVAKPMAPVVHIVLRSDIVLNTRRFTIADVAQVKASDAGLQAQLEHLELGSAPRIGHIELYTREELNRALRSRLSQAIAVDWEGAQRVKVSASEQSVDGTALFAAATNFLQNELNSRYDRVVVYPLVQPTDIALPIGEVTYQEIGRASCRERV